jgi:hypothetical protein
MNKLPKCLICGEELQLKLAKGRKSGKAFLMLFCPYDGRHFRGFICDRPYVGEFIAALKSLEKKEQS